jgi:hypothetical protein
MPFAQYDIAPLEGTALWSYLERARTMRLATVAGDEPIEVSSVWFVVRRETLHFWIDPTVGDPGRSTTPASRHLPALDASCRVSAIIDDGDDLTTFRGVQIAGKAVKVTQAALQDELLDLALEKYFYVRHPHLEHFLATGSVQARLWFRLDADWMKGWDRRHLPQAPLMDRRILPPEFRIAKKGGKR